MYKYELILLQSISMSPGPATVTFATSAALEKGPDDLTIAAIVRPFENPASNGKCAWKVALSPFFFTELIERTIGLFCPLMYAMCSEEPEILPYEVIKSNVLFSPEGLAPFEDNFRVWKDGRLIDDTLLSFLHESDTMNIWSTALKANSPAEAVKNGDAEGDFFWIKR